MPTLANHGFRSYYYFSFHLHAPRREKIHLPIPDRNIRPTFGITIVYNSALDTSNAEERTVFMSK